MKHEERTGESVRTPLQQTAASSRPQISGKDLPIQAMLAMQRKVGNQALMQLMSGHAAPDDKGTTADHKTNRHHAIASGPVMQRRLIEYMPKETDPVVLKSLDQNGRKDLSTLTAAARLKAKEIDGYVNKARDNVQTVIDNVIAGRLKVTQVAAKFPYSGHATNFQNKLMDHISGTPSVHPSAPGGYLIEDYASANVSGVGIQVTPGNLRGSRPDFMIPMADNNSGPGGNTFQGLVDATSGSTSSIGHILRKGGGAWVKRTEYPYVAESLYDPLSFGTATRQLSDDEMQAISNRAMEKRQAEDNAKAEQISLLKRQYEETHDNVLAYLNSGDPNAHMVPLLRLSGSRTRSKLSLIGIDYDPENNEVETSEPFEDWVKDNYVDALFNTPTRKQKTDALLQIMNVIP